MERLWNHKDPIHWHLGATMTAEELYADPKYKTFEYREIVLCDNGTNSICGFYYLDELKTIYNVTEDDPEKALALVQKRWNIPQTTIQDLEEATLELSTGQAENAEAISLVEDAILELSIMMLGE